MKVFVTGGSGFVGRALIKKLLDARIEVQALSHSSRAFPDHPLLSVCLGDTTRFESLDGHLAGCDAVIHLVGIIREFPGRGITFERLHTESTGNLIAAAHNQGVKRFLHMSANGTREQGRTAYHRTKWAAEEQVRRSQLDWTIFRPSLIYGPGDAFTSLLARLIRTLPVVPVFGDGQYQLQPVHVDDIATAFSSALEREESIAQTYSCCGEEVFSYDQLLDNVGRVLGKKKVCKLHQPLALMRPIVSLMQSLPPFPITSDQLQMLIEGNLCQDNSWRDDFSIAPRQFEEAIRAYI